MDVVTVKFQPEVLKRLDDSLLKNNYNSRTEFIREAVRDKLDSLSREQLIEEFLRTQGKAKVKTTDKERRLARKLAFEELSKEKGWD